MTNTGTKLLVAHLRAILTRRGPTGRCVHRVATKDNECSPVTQSCEQEGFPKVRRFSEGGQGNGGAPGI